MDILVKYAYELGVTCPNYWWKNFFYQHTVTLKVVLYCQKYTYKLRFNGYYTIKVVMYGWFSFICVQIVD